MEKPTLVILAAGIGSRYGGIKQLDRFGPSGQALMDYAIEDAILAGFGKIVFTIRQAFAEAFEEQIMRRYEGRIEMSCAFQEMQEGRAKPWGPAEALLVSRSEVPGDLLMINADDFYGREAFVRAHKFLTAGATGAAGADGASAFSTNSASASAHAIIGYPLKETLSAFGGVSRGICAVNEAGFMTEIYEGEDIREVGEKVLRNATAALGEAPVSIEELELPAEALVSMNMMAFRADFYEYLAEAFAEFKEANAGDPRAELNLPMVLNPFVQQGGKVQVVASGSQWFGVTYADDKPAVMKRLDALAHLY